MAAKKREIYARAAVQLRSHERPSMAEKRCPGAMGLYLFLLLQARGEETWGDVAELIAHTSWGAPAAYRRKQAEALIFAGLVERREDGRLHVVKYEEHNDTPDTIEANRKGSRERKQVSRDKHRDTSLGHIDVTRDSGCDIAGTDASVPISSSIFNSGSDLDPDPEIPSARAKPDPAGSRPDWWGSMLETLHMNTGEILHAGEAWLRYAGHRAGKNMAANRTDALYWLTTVMVPELRKAREDKHHRDARDAKFDQERARQRGGIPESSCLPIPSDAEAEANARRFAERIARSRKGAA